MTWTKDERTEFLKNMGGLYTRATLSGAEVELIADTIGRHPLPVALEALKAHKVESGNYLNPTAKGILEHVKRLRQHDRPQQATIAELPAMGQIIVDIVRTKDPAFAAGKTDSDLVQAWYRRAVRRSAHMYGAGLLARTRNLHANDLKHALCSLGADDDEIRFACGCLLDEAKRLANDAA